MARVVVAPRFQSIDPNDASYAIRRFDGELKFLCELAPNSTYGCKNDWEAHHAAQKRLQDIELLSIAALQGVLRSRGVAHEQDEEKDSLVRKVVVTDQKKARKSEVYLRNTLISMRKAPGAELRGRQCLHGSVEPDDELLAAMELAFQYTTSVYSDGSKFGDHVAFWTRRLPKLRDELERRLIPRSLWGSAVSGAVEGEGQLDLCRLYVFGTFVTNALQDVLEEQSTLKHQEANEALKEPISFNGGVERNFSGQKELFRFMHRPDVRRCECMKYVVTAAEMGTLRDKPAIFTDVDEVDLGRCALCDNVQGLLCMQRSCLLRRQSSA